VIEMAKMSERYRPETLKRMKESAKTHLKRQLLKQVGTFGKKPFVGQNPLENMCDIHLTAKLMAKAEKVLEKKRAIKPRGLCEKLGMEPTKGNSTLCAIILKKLDWKKWNEKCHSNCMWFRGDAEFD